MAAAVSFVINGKSYTASPDRVPIYTTLNTFIREHAKLRGTKFMCLEGGCGTCIVMATGPHPVTKAKKSWAINSCLVSVYSCQNLEITTIEGIGDKKNGYHAFQKRLTDFNGTQCGYCSPGMVMNMYGLYEAKKGQVSMEEIENSFGGNICRCTGYRPIMDAFKGLAVDATDDLKKMCNTDIEDLKICPKSGEKCGGLCKVNNSSIKLVFDDNTEWHKVNTITELCDLFGKIENKKYMLVAGNTAHGVYRRDADIQVFVDISTVAELKIFNIGDTLELGANCSLTETMDIFEQAAKSNPKFEYCRKLINHIDLVANVPVRNIGTLAGNLTIKHQHNEFQSDIYLCLETVKAKLTILDASGKANEYSPLDFLKVDMKKKLISKISLPQLAPGNFVYRSFKIMPRAQNTHALVNAGFLIELNDKKDQVVSANICYGAINPQFTHAMETEKYLVGKNLYKNEILQGALAKLSSELNPDSVLSEPSPEFRRNLALGLFYKMVLSSAPDGMVKREYKSGGEIMKRELSSGKQTFDTYEKNYPLTQPIPKLEAIYQCSGEAQYTNDIPPLPNQVWAAFVHATKIHCKISSINASDALKMPGVVAFYSAKDIPGENNFFPKSLGATSNEPIFCDGEVLYHGQPVGIIVADDFHTAYKAVKLVEVIYEKTNSGVFSSILNYLGTNEPLVTRPIVTSAKEIIEKNITDRIVPYEEYNIAATNQGLGTVHKISDRFEIGAQYHFTMETQQCVCVPVEDGMDVHSATQWMDLVQCAVSTALKIPAHKINLKVRRVGGAYGAKISRCAQVACAAALACHLLNRPVRFVLTIESNMTTVGKRWACISDYNVEVDDKGKIQKLTNEFFQDGGYAINENPLHHSSEFCKNCYESSTFTINGKMIVTDSPAHTWCRSPGTTEGIAMIENIMEHIARITKQLPEDVRLVNMAEQNPMKKTFKEFLKSVELDKRRKEIDTFNTANRWRKRGIAVVPMQYPFDYFGHFPAFVSIYHADGTVAITHGGIEMGQGINTKVAQVAAHILGVPLSMIQIKPSENVTSANGTVSGGSAASESVAFAVKTACETILARMKPTKDEMKGKSWPEVVAACFNKNIDLTASYLFKPTDAKPYIIYGCSCAEIEVDLLTGNFQLRRVDILEDTGESLSPLVDVGQVEGAFVMGIGYWLHEILISNRENGELLTNRTWNYHPPTVKDIPVDFRVTFLQKSSNPYGVLRSKTTGEPSLCMSIVVIFALRSALDAARKDAKETVEWYPMGSPTSPETVFAHSGVSMAQFTL